MISTGRSLWADTMPDGELARTAEDASWPAAGIDVDVVVVGAGFTGLWTAWYLLRHDPTLRVVVLEREHVGFGASGRNGGWCSALLPVGLDRIAARHGEAAAARMQRAMHDTVLEVGRFVDAHGAPGMFEYGGTVDLARSAPHAARLRHELGTYRRFGFDDRDYRWLGADESRRACDATGVVGALATPHCAAIHPLRTVHALARAVLAGGGEIREGVAVTGIEPRRVATDHGPVRADVVVRATEAYTAELPGHRRSMLPIYSMMIATEPLDAATWERIGLHDRPTFADGRHLIIYGQRTHDDRFAFGGRGAPYHFGSRIDPRFDTDVRIAGLLVASLRAMFPAVTGGDITHHWGGVLGAARDWHPSVRYDRRTGLASAGGYVGDGVATTNLAGRTLAALITNDTGITDGGDRELTTLPFVGHRSRRWEPEPLRWIGVNAGRISADRADRAEERSGRTSRFWGGGIDALLGR